MPRGVRAVVLVLVLVLAVVAGGLIYLTRRGFSALEEPTAAEAWVALRLRNLAIPADARRMENPLPLTPDVLSAGLAHFADHCAVCHANDGSGEADFGERMYPRTPDMRLSRTQSLTDGELFYIIENGIRFTGMPGFYTGTADGSIATWELVHFIRHLPDLTEDELAEMEQLNPRTLDEWEREQEMRRFLEELEQTHVH